MLAPRQVSSFSELLALRVGFAAAQATQNPICFSLIPELFPAERTTAMAAYNSAIYMGRVRSSTSLGDVLSRWALFITRMLRWSQGLAGRLSCCCVPLIAWLLLTSLRIEQNMRMHAGAELCGSHHCGATGRHTLHSRVYWRAAGACMMIALPQGGLSTNYIPSPAWMH